MHFCERYAKILPLTVYVNKGGVFTEKINETQQKIYEYLVERSGSGYPPSVREIGAAVGLRSTSSVQASLDALEQAGYISRDPLLKRSIRVNGRDENVTHVPLLGTVTAGAPILAVEQIEGYVPYAGRAAGGKTLFALNVRGESMLNAGILDGDIVIADNDVRHGVGIDDELVHAHATDDGAAHAVDERRALVGETTAVAAAIAHQHQSDARRPGSHIGTAIADG